MPSFLPPGWPVKAPSHPTWTSLLAVPRCGAMAAGRQRGSSAPCRASGILRPAGGQLCLGNWTPELCFKASNACLSSCWHVSYSDCAKAWVWPENVNWLTSDSAISAWEGNHFVQDSSCMYLNPVLVFTQLLLCFELLFTQEIWSCFVLSVARHSLTWNTSILLH